jgi:hypothetical protein
MPAMLRILFIHQNLPGQFRRLIRCLQTRPDVGFDPEYPVSYGRRPPEGVASHREAPCAEQGDSIDRSRVHFLGKLPYASYRTVLQVSSLHIYLTYPFVLSWSVLKAMAVDGVAQLRFRIGGLAGLPRAAEAIAAAR